ncbi:MAG: 50S ribosomal protein P1 [Candidatus Micrarchaeota archaeon]
MQYVYAAMLLHSGGQQITEESVKKVLAAGNAKTDDVKVKALVAALEGVNIDEAVKQAAVAPVAAAPAGAAAEEKKADEPSEEQKEAEASAGLASLFG